VSDVIKSTLIAQIKIRLTVIMPKKSLFGGFDFEVNAKRRSS